MPLSAPIATPIADDCRKRRRTSDRPAPRAMQMPSGVLRKDKPQDRPAGQDFCSAVRPCGRSMLTFHLVIEIAEAVVQRVIGNGLESTALSNPLEVQNQSSITRRTGYAELDRAFVEIDIPFDEIARLRSALPQGSGNWPAELDGIFATVPLHHRRTWRNDESLQKKSLLPCDWVA
jgi:hypothetical protein